MKKKILSNSVKLTKLSTWVVGISALFVTLLIAIIVIFPILIKTPIEAKLSELSGLEVKTSTPNFNFRQGELSLQIRNFRVFDAKQNLVATVHNLKWKIYLYSLFKDVFRPSEVFIGTLTLYPDAIQTKKLAFMNAKTIGFFSLLSINKTVIKGEKKLEIAPILLTHDKLKITGQNFAFSLSDIPSVKVDIDITLPSAVTENTPLIVPILISNDKLSINAEIRFSNKKGDDWLEFKGNLAKIQANSLVKYLPLQLLGNETYAWIKRGFIAGSLQDIKLHIKKNLSKSSSVDMQFSTELKEMELLFHSDWKPLKKLNASLTTDGKKIMLMVHNTKLNTMSLKNIKVQIADLSQKNLDVEVISQINTQSEHVIEFLKRTPLDKKVHEALYQFSLSGKVDGDMKLVVPLDKRVPILDVDLTLKNNRLAVLDGAVVVKNYNAKLGFHNNKIIATGMGDIRDLPFDIRINLDNNDNKSTFGVKLVSNNGLEAYITKQLDQSWRARIESELVKGNIAIFLNEGEPLNVRLSGMQVANLDTIKGDWKITPQDFPNMHLSAQDIYVDKDVLPNFTAELISKDNLLKIKNLKFEGFGVDSEELSFQGSWDSSKTQLHAKAKNKNLTEFLENLKIKEKVTGGEFNFDVYLACECAPWNMNYQDITGYLDLHIKEGVFTDKDPNLGRILSLLNINSIAKRLKLDVSDVTDKGFTYEDIEAKILLQDASAKIEHFNLNALSGNIVLTGQGDLLGEQYDLIAKVTPAISGAVPAATYLAGGGLIGLGVWVVDKTLFDGKIINSIVDEVVEFKYKITGPWNEPIITPL